MIVLDANLLLYAYDKSSSQHSQARHWVEQVFSDSAPIGIPLQSIAAFLRITTNPRLPGRRFGIDESVRIVDSWLQQPHVRLLTPGTDCWPLLQQTILQGQASGPLISDAQLAAITAEFGGVLHTTDRDFARFPGLRWKNPLV